VRLGSGDYKPPAMTKGLNRDQRRELDEVRSHVRDRRDESLLRDYRRTMVIRDGAAADIAERGSTVDRKSTEGTVLGRSPNPAFRVMRDAQTRLADIRRILMLDPVDRTRIVDQPHKPRQRQGGVYLDDPDDDGDWMLDDDDDQPARALDPNDSHEKHVADMRAADAADPRRRRRYGFALD
jgi:phage terminase small subunit